MPVILLGFWKKLIAKKRMIIAFCFCRWKRTSGLSIMHSVDGT